MSDAGDDCDRRFGLPWPEMNDGLSYDDVVSPSDNGSTLIEFYGSKYGSSAPLQGWMQRIRNGQVRCSFGQIVGQGGYLRDGSTSPAQVMVDGRVTTNPDEHRRAGSKLVYHRMPWKEPDAPYEIEILYEDEHMIALNKPSGLQVLPGGLFQQRTVLSQLQWRERKRALQTGLEPQPVPVHRLGRGTSGILLCAKTKIAKSRLSAYFADGTSLIAGTRNTGTKPKPARKITKFYRALVNGILGEDELIVSQPIGVAKYSGVAKGLYVATPSGKSAVSKVKVLERDVERYRTFVQVEIQSGRPHQIRIHLSFIGHPLICDPLYVEGGKPRCFSFNVAEESFAPDGGHVRPQHPLTGDSGYFLHAHQLMLFHPMTDEVLTITAPLPSILQTQSEALVSIQINNGATPLNIINP